MHNLEYCTADKENDTERWAKYIVEWNWQIIE